MASVNAAPARVLYFDPFAGASGDMILAALVDARIDTMIDACSSEGTQGADRGALVRDRSRSLERRLREALPFDLEITAQRVVRRGIAGTRLQVKVTEAEPPRRGLADIMAIISGGGFPPAVCEGAARTFRALAEAEAGVHGIAVDEVHFHELGAGDALVDILGTHLLLDDMRVERVTCGAVPVGSGTVGTCHGTLPVPAPATVVLLEGMPVSGVQIEGEAVTPTGAALLKTLTEADPAGRGHMPPMSVTGSGWGFGARESTGALPNALRVIVGGSRDASAWRGGHHESVTVLETTIDDMPGEWAGDLFEVLGRAGALEVSTTPVGMKKSRPGIRLTVVAPQADAASLAEIMTRESTTFGVRMRREERLCLARETREVETPWGEVGVKIGRLAGEVVQVSPEYEDCRRLARTAGVPLKQVYEAALAAFRASQDSNRR